MTRKMTIAILVLALCAILLPSTLIAKDKVTRPLKVQGHTTAWITKTDLSVETEEWGQHTHIGRYTSKMKGYLFPFSVKGTLTAANGDQLFSESTVEGEITITGGTGRFEGATGAATWVGTVPEIIYEDEETQIVEFTYTGTGTITY